MEMSGGVSTSLTRDPCDEGNNSGSGNSGSGSTGEGEGESGDGDGNGSDSGNSSGSGGISISIHCGCPPQHTANQIGGLLCNCDTIIVQINKSMSNTFRDPCEELPLECYDEVGDPCPCNVTNDGCDNENLEIGINIMQLASAFNTFFGSLSNAEQTWIDAHPELEQTIRGFLIDNIQQPYEDPLVFNGEALSLANEAITFLIENPDSEEAITGVNIALNLYTADKLLDFNTSEHDAIVLENLPEDLHNSLFYYNAQVMREMSLIIATEHSGQTIDQIGYWKLAVITARASSETIHMGLAVAGMAPGIGIIFDVTDAAVYTIEGDLSNAGFSLGSAIPIVGQWVTTAKWSKKIVNLANGKRVYLKVYNLIDGTIKFSGRTQLRKVLGITDSATHAHHIIPYGQFENQLVQMAAKSNNVWHTNDIYNGIPMLNSLHLTGHQAYTNRVIDRMNDILGDLNPSDYDGAYDALIGLCDEIKNIIQLNPNATAGQIATLF